MSGQLIDMIPGALQRELDRRGLTYEAAGDLVGRSATTIARLAHGQTRGASRGTALELLLLLDVRPSAIFRVNPSALVESRGDGQ